MYLTLEVRWFYPGPLPSPLLDWLHTHGSLPAAQPLRVDHYLRLPEQCTLGIKLREGNVEVKARLGNSRQVEMPSQATGELAFWRKWSFPLALGADAGTSPAVASGASLPEQLLVPASAWLAVEKARRLQRYRLSGAQEPVAVLLGAPAAQGCEFELSQVRAVGQEWWSACFEAIGSESGLERALRATAAKVLGAGWPLPLDAEHSLSYPAWLARFAAAATPPNQ
jgi:hypothetical protein